MGEPTANFSASLTGDGHHPDRTSDRQSKSLDTTGHKACGIQRLFGVTWLT